MRYTPFLDKYGITIKGTQTPEQIDHLVNVLDSALAAVEQLLDWGSYEGRERKPCPEQPLLLAGMPIGQYHCPVCGMMVMAAMPHLTPGAPPAGEQDERYPLHDYETEYGRPWPPGYQEAEAA